MATANTTIMVAGGKPLVEGGFTWGLSTANNAGVQDVYWEDSSGTAQNITTQIESGELKGCLKPGMW